MHDAPHLRRLRALCLALASLPLVLALIAHGRGATARPVAAGPERPGLAFSQYLVDLGPVAPSEEVLAHFDFRNTGETAVLIDGIETSCGCMTPYLRRKDYLPGQRGSFTVHVQTANQDAGPREYRVTVNYSDPHPRKAELLFRVTLPENKVFVRPRALVVSRFDTSEATDWDIEILDRRPEPLTVVRADCTRSGLVQIEPGRTEVDDLGHTHIHLQATIAGELPAGRYDALIRIFTADPEYRVLRVPLRVAVSGSASPTGSQVRTVGATEDDLGG